MNAPALPKTLPSQHEVTQAIECSRVLSAMLKTRAEAQQINFCDDNGESHTVQLPMFAVRLLVEVLTEIGQGNMVSIIPIHAELTTQEAADVLNVSRPFLVKILERGDIPHHKVGRHRRVRYQDVIAYKMSADDARRKALDELSAQAQELDMGY